MVGKNPILMVIPELGREEVASSWMVSMEALVRRELVDIF